MRGRGVDRDYLLDIDSKFEFVLISGKHLHSMMVVQDICCNLACVILFLLPAPYLMCDILSTTNVSGHHCDNSDRFASPSISAPECTLSCMTKPKCIATNYNSSDGTCQLLPATCVQASDDPVMTYTIYASVYREQCLEWVDHYPLMPVDARSVMTKVGGDEGKRVFARMRYEGEYYPSHYTPKHGHCFATNGLVTVRSDNGHPCQLLRMKEGCTMAFVSYTAGDALPVGAIAVPNIARSEILYNAAVDMSTDGNDGPVVAGFYTEGAAHATCLDNGIKYSTKMRLIIII